MPMASQTGCAAAARGFQQDARDLAAVRQHIVGPFHVDFGVGREAASRCPRRRSPATKESCAHSRRGLARASSSVAARLPAAIPMSRPRRPRPAVWRPARSQIGPRSPRAARRRASSLVESISSNSFERVARRPGGHGRSACAAVVAAVDQQAPTPTTKKIVNTVRRQMRCASSAPMSPSKARRGLVEIHDLDDAQIIVGAHHARQHADDRGHVEMRLDRGEEDVELGEEARERRNAGKAEHQRGERKREPGLRAREAGEIGDVLHRSRRRGAWRGCRRTRPHW